MIDCDSSYESVVARTSKRSHRERRQIRNLVIPFIGAYEYPCDSGFGKLTDRSTRGADDQLI